MTTATTTSALRDAHKELTRERILDAAIDLLNEEGGEDLTNADVAKAAGVTERTVYRHFASREDLLRDAWVQLQKRIGSGGAVSGADDLVAMPMRLFESFDKMPGAIRASAFSRAGREMRMAVNKERQRDFMAAVKEARPDLKGDALVRMTAICQLICSAWSWSVMRDYWDLDAKESGRAASDAISVLLGVDLNTGEASSPNVRPQKTRKHKD